MAAIDTAQRGLGERVFRSLDEALFGARKISPARAGVSGPADVVFVADEAAARPVKARARRVVLAGYGITWLIFAFLFLTAVVMPALAVATVGSYGLAVWIYQMVAGPPGPPTPH